MIVPCLQGLNKSTLLEHAWNKHHWMIVSPLQALLRIEENSRSKNACHFETTIHIPIMFEENPQLNLDLLNHLNLDLLNLGCKKFALSPWNLCFLRNNGAAYTCPQTKKTRASSTLLPSTIMLPKLQRFKKRNLLNVKSYEAIWVFPKIVVPQNGWFIRENPIKMDDLGIPLFLETPIWSSKWKFWISLVNEVPGHWSYSCFLMFVGSTLNLHITLLGLWPHCRAETLWKKSMHMNPKTHLCASTEDHGGWESPRVKSNCSTIHTCMHVYIIIYYHILFIFSYVRHVFNTIIKTSNVRRYLATHLQPIKTNSQFLHPRDPWNHGTRFGFSRRSPIPSTREMCKRKGCTGVPPEKIDDSTGEWNHL